MKIFGLIGYPLTHSLSQKLFIEKFQKENIKNVTYKTFPLKNLKDFNELFIQNSELAGLNVTIPYKEQIIKHMDEIDDIARKVGAVNTIKIKKSKNKIKLIGYNTDVYGFYHSLRSILKPMHKNALILGTGGASKAVAYVLQQLDIKYFFISRNPETRKEISYSDLCFTIIDSFNLIVNTTPLGTYPNVESYPPIPYEFLSKDHILYDLVYNPGETLFLKMGKQKNATTINGLSMLKLQAEKAWEIWNSKL